MFIVNTSYVLIFILLQYAVTTNLQYCLIQQSPLLRKNMSSYFKWKEYLISCYHKICLCCVFFCGSFCLSRLVLLSCFILASFFHLLLSIMCPKPVVRVCVSIVRPLHVRCHYIRFMNVNDLHDLRDVLIRSLAVLD